MRYYLLAGEPSGDLHGAALLRALRDRDPAAEFRYWGGDRMAAVSGAPQKHVRDLAFMGFWEVATNLRTILGFLDEAKRDIAAYRPDALILIDYPGFNLRLAKWAKKQRIRTVYFISPQIWAWKESRLKTIKAAVDQMLVILPFEQDWYAARGYAVDYVGHPLVQITRAHPERPDFRAAYGFDERPLIALLPGSRKQEIERLLDVMLRVVPHFADDYQFAIAGAPAQHADLYYTILQKYPSLPPIPLIPNETYDLLRESHAALVTSGTATLEAALFGVPQIVCYKSSGISYAIAKRLVKIKYISLVNLLLDRELVTELIQGDCNPERLRQELTVLLGIEKYLRVGKGYAELQRKLRADGDAAGKAAGLIVGGLGRFS